MRIGAASRRRRVGVAAVNADGRVRAAAGSVVDARRKEAPLKHLHGHRPHDPDPPRQGWRGRGLAAAGGRGARWPGRAAVGAAQRAG